MAIGNSCPGQRGHGWCDVIGATTDARKYRFSVKERRKSLHVTKKPLIGYNSNNLAKGITSDSAWLLYN